MVEQNTDYEGLARALSRMLFDAREEMAMWAEVVEAQSGRPAGSTRRHIAEIDAFRAEQGWSPHGFGGESALSIPPGAIHANGCNIDHTDAGGCRRVDESGLSPVKVSVRELLREHRMDVFRSGHIMNEDKTAWLGSTAVCTCGWSDMVPNEPGPSGEERHEEHLACVIEEWMTRAG